MFIYTSVATNTAKHIEKGKLTLHALSLTFCSPIHCWLPNSPVSHFHHSPPLEYFGNSMVSCLVLSRRDFGRILSRFPQEVKDEIDEIKEAMNIARCQQVHAVHIAVCTYVCMCVRRPYVRAYACVYVCLHSCTHIYTYTHSPKSQKKNFLGNFLPPEI